MYEAFHLSYLSICPPILLVLFLWRILIWQSASFLGFSTRNYEGHDVVRSRSEKWEKVEREARMSQDQEEDSHTWEAAVSPSSREQQAQRHQCVWAGGTERSSAADGGCACSQPYTLSPDCFLVPVLIPCFLLQHLEGDLVTSSQKRLTISEA